MHRVETVIILDRGKFIDVLKHLRRGGVLVRAGPDGPRCALDGSMHHTALLPLLAHGLIEEVEQDDPDSGMHGDRLSDRGHAVAERACEQWKRTPLLQRLAVRMAG